MMSRRVLCFDLGASGGRAILAGYNSIEKRIELEEVYRFRNRGVEVNGTMYWDILGIYSELRTGLVKAHKAGGFCSVGIDTWGVDQGILDSVGQLIGEPVQYRDSRTKGMVRKAEQYISVLHNSRTPSENGQIIDNMLKTETNEAVKIELIRQIQNDKALKVFIPYTEMKERISTCRRTRYWVLTAARLLLRL